MKITEIKKLLKEWKQKEALAIYKTLSEDEKKEFEKKNSYQNTKWHYYSWFNLFVLSITKEPWTFWTFKQWLEEWKCVKKGECWLSIIMPIFDKKDKAEIKFFKRLSIFAENQTEKINK